MQQSFLPALQYGCVFGYTLDEDWHLRTLFLKNMFENMLNFSFRPQLFIFV